MPRARQSLSPTRGVIHRVDHQKEKFTQPGGENVFARRGTGQFGEDHAQGEEGDVAEGQGLHVEGDRRRAIHARATQDVERAEIQDDGRKDEETIEIVRDVTHDLEQRLLGDVVVLQLIAEQIGRLVADGSGHIEEK